MSASAPPPGLPWSRRTLLQAGALFGFGLARPGLLSAQEPAPDGSEGSDGSDGGAADLPPPRARSVIHVFLPGGMAHQETFDPKPYSPLDYRGEVKTVDTVLPGVRFGQHLKRTAKIADRLTVIRAFSHGEADHARGCHNILTGYRPSPAVVYPSLGSVVAHELGGRAQLPPYGCVPNVPNTYAGTGYLSASFAPFALGSDPARGDFRVRDLDLPDGVDGRRFARRRALRDLVDAGFEAGPGGSADAVRAMESFYGRAYELLSSPAAVDAFRIDREPKKVRDRYGRHEAGQRLLLARRLVESGVRYVTVSVGSWDMHERIAQRMRERLPSLDQAYATLIADLDERGLLDETLVLLTTEFGRTPKVNQDGGRDHWPGVFSLVLAGGGVRRGFVYGASDSTASAVEEKGVGPEDLARTALTLLGIDPDRTLLAGGNRPLRLVSGGRVLRDVLA